MSRTGAINATYMWRSGRELEPNSCPPEDPLEEVFTRIASLGNSTMKEKPRRGGGGRKTPFVLPGSATLNKTEFPDPFADFQSLEGVKFDAEQVALLTAVAELGNP